MNPLATSTDLHRLMAAPPPGNTTSFTALLGLHPPKALELLHSPEPDKFPVTLAGKSYFDDVQSSHPFDNALIERAVFACSSSPEGSSVSAGSKRKVKAEQPAEIESENDARTAKRKERENKGKGSSKKSRSKNESSVDGQELPYVHVRARRGQATDSHSLAERARREKINARMKLLQEIVPGCNKISGTALVLDEIINHVQSLQHQVEFLSMRLAAVTPSVDLNLDRIFAAESGSFMGSDITRMVIPPLEGQISGRQQYLQQWHTDSLNPPVWGREEVNHSFVAQGSSLLSFNASANSVSLPSNHVKMEL